MIEQDIKQRSLVVLMLNSRIHSDVVVLSFDKLVVAVSSLNGYLLRLKRHVLTIIRGLASSGSNVNKLENISNDRTESIVQEREGSDN
ncbi:hypothetical protein AXX17_AT5G47210 [Arabidopsis thaliana]|uniref:Uncharacterized protein n=1 Tax=Arabidopsis thaliana TaxID=3702 RepID=A0A178UAF5_ARATH|nr:hypothetical protein AXX17_AT5G47210 [Arabidopsis thaliana]